MDNFYSKKELETMGFKKVGINNLISKKSSFYGTDNIEIGDNVRIDDFCILSGDIKIGSNVHISAYTALYGRGEIIISDYCGCSPRCILLSGSDDFSGEFMIGPMAPEKFTNVKFAPIIMEKFSQLGANTIVMPGVTVGEGAVTGIMTYVKENLKPWTINVGTPSRILKERNKEMLNLYEKLKETDNKNSNININ